MDIPGFYLKSKIILINIQMSEPTNKEKDLREKTLQVRLLLPESWIHQLDSLARMSRCGRLALIRSYLRESLDRDLIRLSESRLFRERIDQIGKVAESLSQLIEDDDW